VDSRAGRATIEQRFRVDTIDGSFEEFYPWNLEEVRRIAEEESPVPGYILHVEPLGVVRVPRRYLREGL